MNRRILIVVSNFWPEPTGISIYSTDLASVLTQSGNSVLILTGLPHYPWWKIPKKYEHLIDGVAEYKGIKVLRVKHFIPPKMNALIRMRFECSLWWNLLNASRGFKTGDFDLVLAFIPTVAGGIVCKRIAKKLDLPFGLIVQDLSGVGATQSGLRGGTFVSKFAHAVESNALKAANGLVVVSHAMQHAVIGSGVQESRVSQILNYSARKIEPKNRAAARSQFGWPINEFAVVHTGNMGAKQDLKNVVQAAEFLKTNSRIKIYFVGHGNQERYLKTLCFGKKNISIMDAVPDEDYSALLSAADLLLVNERKTQKDMSLPSKLTSYLYSERPVIAAVPRGGATWKFLEGVAELVEAGDSSALASKIDELSQNQSRLDELAKLGLEFAIENLDPVVGRAKYLEWVEKLIHVRKNR